jgi:hypothetical protein
MSDRPTTAAYEISPCLVRRQLSADALRAATRAAFQS